MIKNFASRVGVNFNGLNKISLNGLCKGHNKFFYCLLGKFRITNKFQNFYYKSFSSIKDYSESNSEINQDKIKEDINSSSTSNLKNEEMFNSLNEDFEKSLSSNEENCERRVRLLSIKFLQFTHSREILKLFEDKYIKGLVNNIYGEELSLFVYFYVSFLDKEIRDSINSRNKNLSKTSNF